MLTVATFSEPYLVLDLVRLVRPRHTFGNVSVLTTESNRPLMGCYGEIVTDIREFTRTDFLSL